ncbi:hypothetical protein GCM10011575_47470 [Microlunatus endophyticus]|uniref:Uncharacterized protein n=1 Tax=Microlunatus endophyticus TaxID=1716077 RepID=A0A917WA85_9ACTN|nr:hypothetical protein [Microlunatus endophyticus]GGL83630.1 hypothetical protein GCM10011575_47470 [Microlunatus endophyticus]
MRVSTVAQEMGVTDRTALGYAPPETIAVNLVRTLLKAHALNEAEKAARTAPTPLSRGAFVYTTAPGETVCARCDEPITKGEPAVSVPGLYRRGLAHQGCVPGPQEAGDA